MIGAAYHLPLVVDIKRSSHEDGPGIRSVVFFKGCPLSCLHCHNPESQDLNAEIAFSEQDCILCGNCLSACPDGAIDLQHPDRINRSKCTRCKLCAAACPGEGLRLVGKYYTVQDLTEILMRDVRFYNHSGGGVTLSGGECTVFPEYVGELLQLLKTQNMNIVIQTSGYFDYDNFYKYILPYVDIIQYDLKIFDSKLHEKYTGKSNYKIMDNLKRLLEEKSIAVHPRIPLVPGITTTRENLVSIVNFLIQNGARNVALLPYNPLGLLMRKKLGKSVPPLSQHFMEPKEEEEINAFFQKLVA